MALFNFGVLASIAHSFRRMWPTLVMVETPTGTAVNLQGDANGYPYISLAGGKAVTEPVELIDDPQDLTDAWADLGPEIDVDGYTKITLWPVLDINDSSNVRFRMLAKHTAAHADEFTLPVLKADTSATPYVVYSQDEYVEFDVDADTKRIHTWLCDGTIKFVKFQVMAGTVGASAGQILSAGVTYAWSP